MASPSIVVFNEAYYLAHNQDVADAVRAGVFKSGLEHWQAYGAAEGRPASAFFDLQTYKDNNGDLNEEAGFVTDADYIRHFTTYGHNEQRVFLSPTVFNADIYAAQNPDLAAAEITDRLALEQHFLRSGIYEGRIAVAGFDPVAYINANADLKALLDAGGNINGYTSANIAKAGLFHYYNFGISEGRTVPAPNPTVTLTAGATSVKEGEGLTFTIKLSIPLATDTTFTFNVTGDTNGGTVDAASTADFGAVSGTITVPAGSTSYQFTITPALDTTLENLEGFKVTLFNSKFVVVDTETAIITDNSANAPQTFTLTTSAESVTGGASTDTVTAVLSTDGSGTTINAGDNINLGGGTDTVNISVTGGNAATVTSVTYTGVENVLVSNFATANTQAFDMTLADSSLSKVGVSASSTGSTTKFAGLKQVVAGQMAGGGSLTLEYASGVASGTADAQSLTLVNVTNGTTGEPIFTANSIETLNVASTGGSNELQVKGDTLTKVVVTGNQALTLTEDAGVLAAVDASALAAALTFTSDNAADFLIKGGAGNDSITLTGAFTAGDTVDGGAGNDTLTVDSDITSALLKNVSNVEHLVLKNGNDLTLASNVSVTDFTVGTGAVVQFNTGYTAATTLTVSSTGTSVSNGANTELTISGSSANIADATITGGTGTDTLNITAGGTVAFTNITNVDKIVVVDAGDATATAGSDITLNLGAYATALTIDASALDAAVSSATDTTAETLTVDGSTATVKLTITGGAGGDTITGGSNNDVINGGDGDDSINGTAGGNDSVSGGAGNDTFNFGDKLTSGDTIDGGDGVDTLIVTSISGTALANVTNVENLALAGSGSTATLSANLSFTSIDMDSADNNAQTLILATGYTNATTVAVDAGDKVENNANVALTVNGTDASLASVTVTGGTGTDTLNIKAASNGGTSVAFAGKITKVDVVNIVDGGDAASGDSARGKDIVLDLGEYATALKIDGTALDAGTLDSNNTLQGDETLTVSGASATASLTILAGGGADTLISGSGNDTIVAGAGNDSIELGSGNDSVDAGAGDDTITVTAGNLNAGDVIDGGDGNDVLNLSSGDVNDTAVFSNVKNVETLKLGATTGTQSVALSTNAGSFSTIDISAAGDQVLTLNIGYTTNVNVIMTGDSKSSDKIVNAAGVALTVTANAADIASTTTIQGGAGTDTLKLKADGGTATLTNVTGVETITVVDGGDATATAGKDITLDLGSYGSALTIDGSALDGAVSTATDSTAETLTVTGGSATAALTITGGGGGDTITSGSGNDVISGGEGADSIIAGSGNDSVDGGAGADSIDAGTGNDTVLGGAGDDTISGGQGADLLTGGAGADTFKYRALNESFGSTIDTITDFVSGTDKLDIADGTGSDTIVFAGNVAGLAAAQLAITNTENSGYRLAVYDTTAQKLYVDWDQNGVINNSDLVISLSGTASLVAADVISTKGAIIGTTIADELQGTAGNDVFFSLGGNDTVLGGDGNDLLLLTNDAATVSVSNVETITGGTGADNVNVTVAGTFTINAGGGTDTLTLANGTNNVTATGVEIINGGTGNDAITLGAAVTSSAITVNGSTGNDSLTLANGTNSITVTFSGLETINGGTGDDAITLASTGQLTVNGSTGSDSLTLANGTNTVSVANVETITGGTGNDALTLTTAGSATVNGSTGSDSLTLANGTNTVSVSNLETITGGTGDDTITVTVAGTFTVDGSTGSDTLTLANGANTVTVSGVETINGGTGDDAITLAAAVSAATITVNGSTGSDSLTLANGTNSITVTFSGLETITGGTGDDTITLGTAGQLTLNGSTGSDSLTLANGTNTVSVSNFETITGGTGDDAITVTTAGTFTVNGSTGSDSLTLANGANTVSVANVETITGGTGDDAITVTTAGTFTVNGSTGSDSLTLANGANTVSVSNVETITGGTGADAITVTDNGAHTITGGAGADVITGGTGADTFVFAAGANGAAPSGTVFDTIIGYQSGTDVIDFGSTAVVQYTTTSTAASGTAGVAAGTGVVTFDGADSSLALRITAVATALGTAAAGNALVFDGTDGTYIYITDGTTGVGANDVLIKLQGVTYDTSHDTLTIVSGDITGLA